MMKQPIFILLSTLLLTQVGLAQSTATFTDYRDGQSYKTMRFQNTVTGDSIVWMAQNLNYKVPGSYAYDDNQSNRKEYGLLYTWKVAKRACPKGWHLPSDPEWSMLVSQFGGADKAGEALKSVNGWKEGGNGTNSSAFKALPAGIRRFGGYENLGYFGFWWTSTPSGEKGMFWSRDLSYGGPDLSIRSKVFRFDGDGSAGMSVRCVRD